MRFASSSNVIAVCASAVPAKASRSRRSTDIYEIDRMFNVEGRKLEDRGWKIENGRWRMEDRGWKIVDAETDRYPPSSILHHLSSLPYPRFRGPKLGRAGV